jgi:hypothetical protein
MAGQCGPEAPAGCLSGAIARGTVANYEIVTSAGTRDGTGQNFGRLALSTGTGGSIDSSGFIFM